MSQVVNVKKFHLRRIGYDDLNHWLKSSSDHVYIGPNVSQYINGAVATKWANPSWLNRLGRDKAMEHYEEYVRSTPDLYNSLEELDGKVLGCWCHPEPCHGNVLMKLLYQKILDKNKQTSSSKKDAPIKIPESVKFRWQKKATD